jgi:hypothetical protein
VTARLVRFSACVAAAVGVVTVCATVAGCGSDEPPTPQESQVPQAGAVEPRADLARRVAAAKDRRFTAAYAWTGAGERRTVTVALASDGTWRVDVPGGAHGGRASVSMVGRSEGVYQCVAGGGCVRVARAAGTVPAAVDPKVHHPFTDWPAVLADPNAALSIAAATQLPGVTGSCFSVEPTTVAIAPPVDPGIFCYADDGVPTGIKTRFGTLALQGAPAPAPPTVGLAGPVSNGAPLGTSPPPPPSSKRP